MLEINAFSVIMLISLSSIISLGIWSNIPDFKECMRILKNNE